LARAAVDSLGTERYTKEEEMGRKIYTEQHWDAPSVAIYSVKKTEATNGSDSDGGMGGIFLVDAPGEPPTKIGIPSDDYPSVLHFLQGIVSSPERLEGAIFKRDETMSDASLTKNQMSMVKRILSYLGQ
jgi:hypothetical protein